MARFRFPIAVAITSLVLVAALVVAGGLLVGNTLASGRWFGGPGGPWFGGHGFGPGHALPAELSGLHDLAPGERFTHFLGAQVNLTDRENKPLAIIATPGTATSVSATSLTIAANDGSTRTFTLDERTIIHGKPVWDGATATRPTLAQDDKVVVMTLNDSTTATAVLKVSPDGFGPRAPHSWMGPGR
jgi:hypothetical protein